MLLPHLFSGKGNWFQSKYLSNELTELAEAQSLLTELWDGIPHASRDGLPLVRRCLIVLAKEVVCLDFGFTGRDGGTCLQMSYSSPLHRVGFLQS